MVLSSWTAGACFRPSVVLPGGEGCYFGLDVASRSRSWFVCAGLCVSRRRAYEASARHKKLNMPHDLGRVCRYFHDPRLPLSNLFVTEVAQALHDAVYAQVRTRLSPGLATAGARHTGTSSAHRHQPESKPTTVPSARRDAVSLCMTARRGSANCSTGRSRSTSCAAASSRARACSRRASVGVRRRRRRVRHHAYDAFPTHTHARVLERSSSGRWRHARRSDTETLTHH